MKEIIEKIEGLGWTVDVLKEEEECWQLGQYSPAGQDFFVVINADNKESIIEKLKEVYEDFDVSEEAYLWLDESGHGRNGAPYDMKDVYEDMQACKNMLERLYKEI